MNLKELIFGGSVHTDGSGGVYRDSVQAWLPIKNIIGGVVITKDNRFVKIMEVLLEKKTTLGTLASEVKIYPQLLENLRVTDKKAVLEHPAVKEVIEQVKEDLGSDGRILVRESGTEPLLRVMVEATTQELCKEYVGKVIETMKSIM
mgnify:CR=1 FL=1